MANDRDAISLFYAFFIGRFCQNLNESDYENGNSVNALFCRVDYTDTFGRSRRCMKKDLPHLVTQERHIEK